MIPEVPKRKEPCPQCRGTGKVFEDKSIYEWGWKICKACNGTGLIEYRRPPWDRSK